MKKLLLLLFNVSLSFIVYSQSKIVTIATESKTIEYTDGRENFNICKANQVVIFKEDLEYYWYNEFSKIKSSKGGAGGNLLHGRYQLFDEKGNLSHEVNFYLGLKDGIEKYWDTIGKIKETFKYNKGKMVYSKFNSENGENIIEWNGPIQEVGSVKKIYTSYGQLEQTELMLEDLKFKITKFYSNGKVKKKFTSDVMKWMYDEYIEYFDNSKIKIYGKYQDDWRVGEWKWYKSDGSLGSTEKYRINKLYFPNNKIMAEGGEYFDPNKNEWIKNELWIWYKENGEDWEQTKEFEYGVEVENK
jgi:antitoxin component YwqK of YwqJK toxin-antitoxin module